MKAHFIIGLACTLCTALGLFAQEPIDRSGVASAVAEARELMEKGQLEEAKRELTAVFKGDPVESPDLIPALVTNQVYYEAAKLVGSVEIRRGNEDAGLKVYEQTLDAKRTLKMEDGEIYNRLGWAYYLNGELERSKEFLSQAVRTTEPVPKETRVKSLNNLGLVCFVKGDLEEAQRVFEQSQREFGSPFAERSIQQIEQHRRQLEELQQNVQLEQQTILRRGK